MIDFTYFCKYLDILAGGDWVEVWVRTLGVYPAHEVGTVCSLRGIVFYDFILRLEKPLTPDVGSSLRDLALFSAQERLKIASKVEAIESGGVPDENIAALNLFICLVAKYFDQGDLVDKEEE